MALVQEFLTGAMPPADPDRVLATFDGPARAIRAADAIRAELRELGLELRMGLHTGECELLGEDIGGIAVHIAAWVLSKAGVGEILCSRTVKDLSPGPALRSPTVAPIGSRAFPNSGSCTRWSSRSANGWFHPSQACQGMGNAADAASARS